MVERQPEASNLIVLRSIEGFFGHAIFMVSAQPAVTKEVPHMFGLEVLYDHLVYIPLKKNHTFMIFHPRNVCKVETSNNS